MAIADLIRLCQSQHGCISRMQALEHVTLGQFNHLVANGTLVRIWQNAYVLAGSPNSWEVNAHAAVLSIQNAVLSHASAARVWGLTYAQSDEFELTVPPAGAKEREGIVVHRSDQLQTFVTVQSGFPVTNVARTLVDLSGTVTRKQLGAYVNQALKLRLVKLGEIQACLDAMVTKGRSRITDMRFILEHRNENDEKVESEFQRRVMNWIRGTELPEPVAERWQLANGTWYRPDLAYPEMGIAIEADGPDHLDPVRAAHDRKRDFDFNQINWEVVHIDLSLGQWQALSRIRQTYARRSKAL